jgi:hypothetical protein
MLNEIIRGIFDGYRTADSTIKKKHDYMFQELEETPFLYSSEYMWKVYHEAESEEECLQVIRYLDKYTTGVAESYNNVIGASWDKYGKLVKKREREESEC